MKNFTQVGRKIIGIGRNYKAHALELGNAAPTKAPIIFLKPTSSYLADHGQIQLPRGAVVHHEVELAVVIGKDGSRIRKENAMNHIGGYALSLDMTARNFQKEAQETGNPWTLAKAFDTFCPIGDFIPKSSIEDPHDLRIWCKVDNQMRQDGNTRDMIFDIPWLVEYVSGIMKLEAGDVILTGTPAGVGPVEDGQVVNCGMSNSNAGEISRLSFTAKRIE